MQVVQVVHVDNGAMVPGTLGSGPFNWSRSRATPRGSRHYVTYLPDAKGGQDLMSMLSMLSTLIDKVTDVVDVVDSEL